MQDSGPRGPGLATHGLDTHEHFWNTGFTAVGKSNKAHPSIVQCLRLVRDPGGLSYLERAVAGRCGQVGVVGGEAAVIDRLQVTEHGVLGGGLIEVPQLKTENGKDTMKTLQKLKEDRNVGSGLRNRKLNLRVDLYTCRPAPRAHTLVFMNLSLEQVASRRRRGVLVN